MMAYLPRSVIDSFDVIRMNLPPDMRNKVASLLEMAFADGYKDGYGRGIREGWADGSEKRQKDEQAREADQ